MQGYTIDQLTVGQQASFSKTISESDVYMFAGVTGDVNPAHVNEASLLLSHLPEGSDRNTRNHRRRLSILNPPADNSA